MFQPDLRAALAALCCVVGLGVLVPASSRAQEPARLLEWDTFRSVPDTVPESHDPGYLMGLGEVQRLLLDVGASRRDGQYIEAALDGTGVSVTDLLAAELVREEGELYTLAFPLLTTENQRVLLEISERYARGLADAYLRQRGEFDELLSRYPVAGIAKTSLAYLLVGCFSLDWDGIQLTQELGYRTPFGTQGVPTVYWAIETENREVAYPKAVYWGSHNEYLDNGIAFTSFGDFASIPRHGLPDLAWYMARSLRSVDVPHELAPIVERVGWGALQGALEQAGAIMMALRSGEKSADEISDATGINSGDTRQLLTLLEALGYVRRVTDDYAIAIPVFAEEDRSMVLDLIDLSREIMTSWLAENYDPCKAELARTTPLGNVLPFENTFWNVWHYLFGAANRILVEQGMFADPYGVDRRYKGFIPAVWHRSVNRRG